MADELLLKATGDTRDVMARLRELEVQYLGTKAKLEQPINFLDVRDAQEAQNLLRSLFAKAEESVEKFKAVAATGGDGVKRAMLVAQSAVREYQATLNGLISVGVLETHVEAHRTAAQQITSSLKLVEGEVKLQVDAERYASKAVQEARNAIARNSEAVARIQAAAGRNAVRAAREEAAEIARQDKLIVEAQRLMAREIESSGKQVKSSYDLIRQSIGSAATAFSVYKGIQFVESTVKAAEANLRLHSTLLAITGSQQEANKEFEYARKIAYGLGIDLQSAVAGYAKFRASVAGSDLTLKETKFAFEATSLGARALGLSADDLSGAFVALSQIAGKNQAQMEELRQQLAERFPGAINAIAKSLGYGKDQIGKFYSAVQSGQVSARQAIVGFASYVEEQYGKVLPGVLNNFQTDLANINNKLFEAKAAFGAALVEGTLDVLKKTQGGLEDVNASAADLGTVFGRLGGVIVSTLSAIIQIGQSITSTLYATFGSLAAGVDDITASIQDRLSSIFRSLAEAASAVHLDGLAKNALHVASTLDQMAASNRQASEDLDYFAQSALENAGKNLEHLTFLEKENTKAVRETGIQTHLTAKEIQGALHNTVLTARDIAKEIRAAGITINLTEEEVGETLKKLGIKTNLSLSDIASALHKLNAEIKEQADTVIKVGDAFAAYNDRVAAATSENESFTESLARQKKAAAEAAKAALDASIPSSVSVGIDFKGDLGNRDPYTRQLKSVQQLEEELNDLIQRQRLYDDAVATSAERQSQLALPAEIFEKRKQIIEAQRADLNALRNSMNDLETEQKNLQESNLSSAETQDRLDEISRKLTDGRNALTAVTSALAASESDYAQSVQEALDANERLSKSTQGQATKLIDETLLKNEKFLAVLQRAPEAAKGEVAGLIEQIVQMDASGEDVTQQMQDLAKAITSALGGGSEVAKAFQHGLGETALTADNVSERLSQLGLAAGSMANDFGGAASDLADSNGVIVDSFHKVELGWRTVYDEGGNIVNVIQEMTNEAALAGEATANWDAENKKFTVTGAKVTETVKDMTEAQGEAADESERYASAQKKAADVATGPGGVQSSVDPTKQMADEMGRLADNAERFQHAMEAAAKLLPDMVTTMHSMRLGGDDNASDAGAN